ncbi:uncharacterized protein EbC_10870 [Erwinia billingiae Eb661]|jgi:hypothetical protein|uniref:Uncharacterized protein n=1 Tax=Erwinia billingiae (strain Eb661) TaxID=634500 RepID=D8MP61_ERWBE|nr:hypothetical protein [Erwinia billingiae]QEW33239.1 hypothetical protein D0N50_16835 [Erwinia billingiae]CAX58618.1 uncharacterized protein EbC_10870 [Erwinia billingiae Eb661]
MKDFYMESIRLQRIDLITRSLVNDLYNDDDKEIAMVWVAEMFTGIVDEIRDQKIGGRKKLGEG